MTRTIYATRGRATSTQTDMSQTEPLKMHATDLTTTLKSSFRSRRQNEINRHLASRPSSWREETTGMADTSRDTKLGMFCRVRERVSELVKKRRK